MVGRFLPESSCVCLEDHYVTFTKALPKPSSGVDDLGLGVVGMQSMTFS